jgi:hypothetical protein
MPRGEPSAFLPDDDTNVGKGGARPARGNGHDKPPTEPPGWPIMAAEAYRSLAGDIVNTIKPHTEADPVALLIQALASVGNAIGRGPYYQVEGDRHGPNLYAVLVGDTAKGRKGTAAGRVRQIMQVADPQWVSDRMHSGGLSSGEGLIWAVHDKITQLERQGKGAAAERVEVVDQSRFGRRVLRSYRRCSVRPAIIWSRNCGLRVG